MHSHSGQIIKLSKNFDFGFIGRDSVRTYDGRRDSRLSCCDDLLFHIRENRELGDSYLPRSLVGKTIMFDVDYSNLTRNKQPLIRNAQFARY
jgi:hypothetical protein